MDGGIRIIGNPARVPPILSAIDQPQEGLPRVIHPIALAVGRPDPDAARTGVISTMDMYAKDVEIDEDVTLFNEQGDPFQFKAGDRISAARASQFPELARRVGDEPIRGAVDARSLAGAPENKARGEAPENRSDGDYASMTVPELRALAGERNLDVPSDARKADIITALSGVGGGLARGNEGTATAPDDDAE